MNTFPMIRRLAQLTPATMCTLLVATTIAFESSAATVRATNTIPSSVATSDALAGDANHLEQADFDDQNALTKQQLLWQHIEESQYQSLPQWDGTEPLSLFLLALNPVRSVVRSFFNVTLERNSDVMPDGRKKGIHTYGSVMPIEFIADGHSPFTGLYRGVRYGLIRLSLAIKPSETSIVPGAAVKFFVDGKPSMNFVAMYSLDGHTGFNFFEHEFFTAIEPAKTSALKLLAAAFATATEDPTKVDVAFLAKTNQDGSSVSKPLAPERLVLVPHRGLEFAKESHDVRLDFETLAAGTTLYDVYGISSGAVSSGSLSRIYIGRIVATSPAIASQFGDQKLFFRHQRFNDK